MIIFQLLATLVFLYICYYVIREILSGKWDMDGDSKVDKI